VWDGDRDAILSHSPRSPKGPSHPNQVVSPVRPPSTYIPALSKPGRNHQDNFTIQDRGLQDGLLKFWIKDPQSVIADRSLLGPNLLAPSIAKERETPVEALFGEDTEESGALRALGGGGRAAECVVARALDCIIQTLPECPRDGSTIHVPLLPVLLYGCVDVHFPPR
jgi:hypothetical protein